MKNLAQSHRLPTFLGSTDATLHGPDALPELVIPQVEIENAGRAGLATQTLQQPPAPPLNNVANSIHDITTVNYQMGVGNAAEDPEGSRQFGSPNGLSPRDSRGDTVAIPR